MENLARGLDRGKTLIHRDRDRNATVGDGIQFVAKRIQARLGFRTADVRL